MSERGSNTTTRSNQRFYELYLQDPGALQCQTNVHEMYVLTWHRYEPKPSAPHLHHNLTVHLDTSIASEKLQQQTH